MDAFTSISTHLPLWKTHFVDWLHRLLLVGHWVTIRALNHMRMYVCVITYISFSIDVCVCVCALLALFAVLIMRVTWTQCTMSRQSCSSKLIETNVVVGVQEINSDNILYRKHCWKGILVLKSTHFIFQLQHIYRVSHYNKMTIQSPISAHLGSLINGKNQKVCALLLKMSCWLITEMCNEAHNFLNFDWMHFSFKAGKQLESQKITKKKVYATYMLKIYGIFSHLYQNKAAVD